MPFFAPETREAALSKADLVEPVRLHMHTHDQPHYTLGGPIKYSTHL